MFILCVCVRVCVCTVLIAAIVFSAELLETRLRLIKQPLQIQRIQTQQHRNQLENVKLYLMSPNLDLTVLSYSQL